MSAAIRTAIAEVMRGGILSTDEAQAAMAEVMDGEATPAQLGGLLLALRLRGEKVDELTGFVLAMRGRVLPVAAPVGSMDTCGTGGDGSRTFNISTASALVVAAAGVPVAKHGNRAMSSATGSADVLEALGIAIDLSPDDASSALRRDGFAFMFAPRYHPAMKHAGPVRRELGVPTAFNLLGPMTNPAGVRRQMIGVADPTAAAKVARVLFHLGTERAFVVHGDGIDELPLDGSGVAYDVSSGGVRKRRIDAAALGFAPAASSELRGGDAAENAGIIESVLSGERGPRRDVVLLNAGAALLVGGRVPTLRRGAAIAASTIDSGRAQQFLAQLRGAGVASSAAASAA